MSLFSQCQGDPELEIKDEPEAWSLTVDKKVSTNNLWFAFLVVDLNFSLPLELFLELLVLLSARQQCSDAQLQKNDFYFFHQF